MDLFAFYNTIFSIQGFVYSPDKHLLSTYSVPGTEAPAVNRIGLVPAFVNLYYSGEWGTDIKQKWHKYVANYGKCFELKRQW